jgi:hypothetical protein
VFVQEGYWIGGEGGERSTRRCWYSSIGSHSSGNSTTCDRGWGANHRVGVAIGGVSPTVLPGRSATHPRTSSGVKVFAATEAGYRAMACPPKQSWRSGESCYLQIHSAAVQAQKVIPRSYSDKVSRKEGVMLEPQLEVGHSFVEAKVVLLKEGPCGFNPGWGDDRIDPA